MRAPCLECRKVPDRFKKRSRNVLIEITRTVIERDVYVLQVLTGTSASHMAEFDEDPEYSFLLYLWIIIT